MANEPKPSEILRKGGEVPVRMEKPTPPPPSPQKSVVQAPAPVPKKK